MKKILLTLLLLGLYGTTTAQEAPGKPQVPEVTLPSPEAYALTKFGDIPVNEFSGMINATIPVYTLKSGKLNVPITLNYSGSGVKVNQLATWTGINWTLNAGGVITRTINDAPDERELITGRLSASMVQAMNLVYQSADTKTLNEISYEFRKSWDFKPDMFNFSFSGYSGTFYLDENFIPRVSKLDSNLKIEIVGSETDLKTRFRNNAAFCITTPDGIRYYFGGTGATENTFTGTHQQNPYAPTGFYLTRIEHPDNGIVYFDYVTNSNERIVGLSRYESVSKTIFEDVDTGGSCTPAPVGGGFSSGTTINTIFNSKTLSKIRAGNNATEVIFNISTGSSGHYANILTSIQVKRSTTVLHEVILGYQFPKFQSNSHRFFLTKVEINKNKNYGHGKKYEQYTLEYDDPNALPDRLSYAQDFGGYYNGVTSNTMVLPKNDDPYWRDAYTALADRSSNFSYTRKGSLKKITYPTGGYTEFEYEPNYAKDYERQVNSMNIWRNDPGRIPTSKLTATTGITGNTVLNPDGSFSFTGAFLDEEIKVGLNVTANAQMGHTDRIYIKLKDLTANTTDTRFVVMPDGSQEIGTGNYSFSTVLNFTILKGHVYNIEISNDYASTIKFNATATYSFTAKLVQIEDVGIRIKRVTDYTAAATPKAAEKRYYYMAARDLSKNILDILKFRGNYAEFVTTHSVVKCCGAFLNTKNAMFSTFASGSPEADVFDKKYEYVTISYGGDNFELGGKEKQFHSQGISSYQEIHLFASSPFQQERISYKGNMESVHNGTLLNEVDILKRGNTLYKAKEQAFTYTYQNVNTYGGTVGGLAYLPCRDRLLSPEHLDIGIYNLYSRRAELQKTVNKDFIEPIPITADSVNEANYKTLTTTIDYQYSLLPGLPMAIKTSTSDDNIATEIRNIYADQPGSLPGLTADQISALNKLVALNKVNTPVEVRSFRYNNSPLPTLMTTQRTLYKSWNGNPNQILPEIIQASKGSTALENRVIIESYDTRGNMTLASMVNGPKTKYNYNALDQVIVKVDNYVPSGGSDTFPEPTLGGPCTGHQNYPESMITWYQYDPVTDLLLQTIDNNCRKTTYEYDALLRLIRIKDHDGNTIQEYDTNYTTN